MLDPKLQQARIAILQALEAAAAGGQEQLAPGELIQRAMLSGVGEEAVRVALWNLVDRRELAFTASRQVRLNRLPTPAEHTAAAS